MGVTMGTKPAEQHLHLFWCWQSLPTLSARVSRLFSDAPSVVVQRRAMAASEFPCSLVIDESRIILRTEYSATTNRMLRVAVNGFMESLGVVLQVMEELDVDMLESKC